MIKFYKSLQINWFNQQKMNTQWTKSMIVVVLINCGIFGYCVHSNDFQCNNNKNMNFLNTERFTDNMCAQCFWYMAGVENAWNRYNIVSKWHFIYNYSESINVLLCKPRCSPFKYSNLDKNNIINDTILSEFKHEFHMNLFLNCCEDARKCCEKMQKLDPNEVKEDGKRCPAKWDGWMCWDSAERGTTTWQTCPDMSHSVLGYMPTDCTKEYGTKECYSNGSWATIWREDRDINNTLNSYYPEEYTNYLKCSTPGATERLRQTHTTIAVYFVSLVFCLIGVFIFIIYKQYKIIRVQIHLNFLSSLILTGFFSILFYFLVREKHYKLESMVDDNPQWCKVLVVLHKGARLTNFCWMLNEGIYLHQLIVAAFREQRRLIFYYLFGWGTPVIIMIPYIIVHSMKQYDNSCWTKSMLYPELVYNVLPLICIVINAILLANVVRVLMTKLRSSPDHFKTGLRASIVLLPIFGLQYAFYVVPIDPFDTCAAGTFVARYIQIVIEALQGAIVTTIFCFLNGEVHSQIRRTIRRRFPKSPEVVTEEQELEKTI